MNEIASSLNSAFTLAFVITSMFGLGLGLTLKDLVAPLRNIRLVLSALAISFVLMQVIVTVIYLPIVLPLLMPGIEVDAVAIALPLFMQIILPLAAGLLMNYRYDEEAEMTRPIMGEISNISLALMLIMNLGNVPEVLALIGTGALASALVIIGVGLAAGYLLGGPDPQIRKTLAIGSGQRNYAAAFVIAQGSLAGQPDVFLMLLTASLVSMVVVLLTAGEMGRRARAAERTAAG